MINDDIQIAFGLYDKRGNYSYNTGCAIISILEHTNSKINFHILTDEKSLTEKNKNNFIKIEKQYPNCKINFHFVNIKEIKTINSISIQRFSIGSLYRLFITDFINSDKIIYLDSDLICLRDIKNLWDIDIENYYIAGVIDLTVPIVPIISQNYVKREHYINSGVLYLNLKKIKEEKGKLLDLFLDFIQNFSDSGFLDQDFFNYEFRNKKLLIDLSWNTDPEYIRKIKKIKKIEPRIYHYMNDRTSLANLFDFDNEYLNIIKRSPWGYESFRQQLKNWARDPLSP